MVENSGMTPELQYLFDERLANVLYNCGAALTAQMVEGGGYVMSDEAIYLARRVAAEKLLRSDRVPYDEKTFLYEQAVTQKRLTMLTVIKV